MSGVEGRWKIHHPGYEGGIDHIEGPYTVVDAHVARPVPVVPCDEAAVGRAARGIAARHRYPWAELSDGGRENMRLDACAALRAAGAVEQ
jgi:hypothetical protein